mmetsp:Transcript_10149/g.28378  ORF Transcript_10149/g.28378 Transcript_10149/m.28378 type:complete len:246 (+) Transcript_10149:430-1167(+)
MRMDSQYFADAGYEPLANRMLLALAVAPGHIRLPATRENFFTPSMLVQRASVGSFLPRPPGIRVFEKVYLFIGQELRKLDNPRIFAQNLHVKALYAAHALKGLIYGSWFQGFGHVHEVLTPCCEVLQVACVARVGAHVDHVRRVVLAPEPLIGSRELRAPLLSILAIPTAVWAAGAHGPDLLGVPAVRADAPLPAAAVLARGVHRQLHAARAVGRARLVPLGARRHGRGQAHGKHQRYPRHLRQN